MSGAKAAAGKAADKVKKSKTAKAVGAGALVGGVAGNVTGSIAGDIKGRKQSDAMFKSASTQVSNNVKDIKEGTLLRGKRGKVNDSMHKAKKSLGDKARKVAGKMPSGRQAKSALGLAAGAALGGYASHKTTKAIQTPIARTGRNLENRILGKKKK